MLSCAPERANPRAQLHKRMRSGRRSRTRTTFPACAMVPRPAFDLWPGTATHTAPPASRRSSPNLLPSFLSYLVAHLTPRILWRIRGRRRSAPLAWAAARHQRAWARCSTSARTSASRRVSLAADPWPARAGGGTRPQLRRRRPARRHQPFPVVVVMQVVRYDYTLYNGLQRIVD